MRAVLQRVARASVHVAGRCKAEIGSGLLILLGAGQGDTQTQADWLADKVAHLRIFSDEQGRMNHSLLDTGGEMIVVSQFTLYGDCRKGRRPSFVMALEPEQAEALVARFIERIQALGIPCGSGEFGAMMQVDLLNDGPVTLLIDTASRRGGAGGFSPDD
jgi:D-tyrosyl-tRNA(Tyr) deacylase